MVFGLDDIIASGLKIIDKFIPDPEAKARANLEMMQIKQAEAFKEMEVALQEQQMQADINKVEAASDNIFVAGPRPFIMWICGVAFGLQFVLFPMMVFIAQFFGKMVQTPLLPMEALMTVLLGTLGLGGYRSWEKIKGVRNGGA